MKNEEIMQKFIYLPSDMEITRCQILMAMDAARQDERESKWTPADQPPKINEELENSKIVIIKASYYDTISVFPAYYMYNKWYCLESNSPLSENYEVKEWQNMLD